MPRKTIRRILPDFAKVLKHPSLRWTEPLIRDPNLLHINRESVSLAVFIGIFAAFIPLPGQTFIAAALAFWLHANLPISVLTIWISNPVTIGPMFYLTHRLGSFLLGSDPIAPRSTLFPYTTLFRSVWYLPAVVTLPSTIYGAGKLFATGKSAKTNALHNAINSLTYS